MDFSLSRRRRKAVKAHTDIEYPCRLQLYSTPPQGNISLAEFESHALDRLAGKGVRGLQLGPTIGLRGRLSEALHWVIGAQRRVLTFSYIRYFLVNGFLA